MSKSRFSEKEGKKGTLLSPNTNKRKKSKSGANVAKK